MPARSPTERALLLAAVAALVAPLEGRPPPSQGPAPNRSASSGFSASCGRTQRLGACPGYAECMAAIYGFQETSFLARAHDRREGTLSVERERPWCSKWACMNYASCSLPFRLYRYTRADLNGSAFAPCIADTNLSDPAVAPLITDDPTRACAFWAELSLAAGGRQCRSLRGASSLPFWGGSGMNHILVDRTDAGISARDRAQWLGRATLAQGHSTAERWVYGLDIALGLTPKIDLTAAHLRATARAAPWERKYLLTFKGTISHEARARAGLHHDERRGVVIASYPHWHECADSTSPGSPFVEKGSVRVLPLHAGCCAQLRAFYRQYDYSDLLNSTFALVMPGRQSATFRLAEVLAAGSIPVYFGFDEALLPYGELIDWSQLSWSMPIEGSFERTLLPLLERAKADRPKMRRMQQRVREVFTLYFSARGEAAGNFAVVETLRRRFELEMRR